MQNLIPINILVGDRTYRIKIEPTDEMAVKMFSKIINEKILENIRIYNEIDELRNRNR